VRLASLSAPATLILLVSAAETLTMSAMSMATVTNMPSAPIIAVVGNVTTDAAAPAAAEQLGRELAKAGFQVIVYSSGDDFLEGRIVRGYVASRVAARRSIQVRYPLHGAKPEFTEQQTNAEVFDWRPDRSQDWEMSFYQSLNEVDGILLMGGGDSTLIAGLVAMGRGMAMLPIAGFGGKTTKVWESLLPGRDLPTADEISLMARPGWSEDCAAECVKALQNQLARKAERERQLRLEQLREETSVSWHAALALLLFVLAVATVPASLTMPLWPSAIMWLLFMSPLLAGVAGSTIRLVFDLRRGSVPLTKQSSVTTAAMGLIAGGVAGLLFVTAQLTTQQPTTPGQLFSLEQAKRLVPFGVVIGFVAGLTLDAVFRKLISTDVVDVSTIEAKKRP
jgi:hypothetical protein